MQHEGMAKPSAHPGFKALYAEWNQKLLDSGFQDIEELRQGNLQLKKTGTMGRFERSAPIIRESKAKYFDIIGQKIVETRFDSDQEKQILCMYFEGLTQTEIAKRLNPPVVRFTVHKKLYKWLKRWKLK
jgi:hypothetical protein